MILLPKPLEPLGRVLPPDEAMRQLIVPMSGNASADAIATVSWLSLEPALQALAWIYIDELDRAHDVCQSMDGPLGAALHAVVHRREGDFWNALYWYRRAGAPDGEGAKLTKAVEAGDRSDATIARQRAEWEALAARCSA